MKQRILTGSVIAVVFIGIILGTLLCHPVFFDIAVLLLAVGAIYEMWACLSKERRLHELIICLAALIVCYMFFIFIVGQLNILGYCFLTLISAFVIECVLCMLTGKDLNSAKNVALILFYPTSVLLCVLALNYCFSVPEFTNNAILLLFLVSSFTDVFAYFGGTLIGGPKLCPNISPKKTVAGAIGGLLGGLIAAGIVVMLGLLPVFAPLNIKVFGTKLSYVINIAVMGLLGSVCTQIGDLIASFVKRQVGIKDYGKLLPGHGGIMDRIDGLMINGFFLFIYVALLQLFV